MNHNPKSIQQADYSWNPIKMTCDPVNRGCDNCWHRAIRVRFGGGSDTPVLDKNELDKPLRENKPSIIAVQFMGDLFHEKVPFEMIERVHRIIEKTAHKHKYLVLTKRPQRLYEYWQWLLGKYVLYEEIFPCWLGVSVCDQETAKILEDFLNIPAAHRWVSDEPALGEVDFRPYLPKLDYIVAGHESGAHARRGDIKHLERLASDCEAAGVPLMIKQGWVGGKLVRFPEINGRVWNARI